MRYYIGTVKTWGPANAKCAEICREVKGYENCLVADELSRDAIVEQLQQMVEAKNAAYPRTKRLVVKTHYGSVYCYPEMRMPDSDMVFSFGFEPVRRVFRFAEEGGMAIEGRNRIN